MPTYLRASASAQDNSTPSSVTAPRCEFPLAKSIVHTPLLPVGLAMELDLAPITPVFFSPAFGGHENIFDRSFNLQETIGDNDTCTEWSLSTMNQMPLHSTAASQYLSPPPPPATITLPRQQYSNDSEDPSTHPGAMLGGKTQHHLWHQVPSPNIDADFNMETARFEHGQFTPPSKSLSPTREAPNSTAVGSKYVPRVVQGLCQEDSRSATQAPRKRTRRSRKRNPPSAEAQREKRERLLERNRMAASKCRQKRKSYNSTLEDRARELQQRKESLSVLANSLKDEVLFLKGQMLRHADCACSRVREYLNNETDSLAYSQHYTFAFSATRSPGARLASSRPSAAATSQGSPLFSDCTSPLSPEHFPDSMESLLKESLMQDTSDEGIAKRTRS